jgi:uncharacterized ion transporter superfamily protein YfcC
LSETSACQIQEEWLQKKTKAKDEGSVGVAVLMIIFFIFSVPVVIYGIITLHFGALGVGLFFFTIVLIWACVQRPNNHNGRNAFYMNRWGSYQAKKNMRRGHRWNK